MPPNSLGSEVWQGITSMLPISKIAGDSVRLDSFTGEYSDGDQIHPIAMFLKSKTISTPISFDFDIQGYIAAPNE